MSWLTTAASEVEIAGHTSRVAHPTGVAGATQELEGSVFICPWPAMRQTGGGICRLGRILAPTHCGNAQIVVPWSQILSIWGHLLATRNAQVDGSRPSPGLFVQVRG